MTLATLPFELLIIIGQLCSRPDQCALARVNHRLYAIFNPILYRHDIFDDEPSGSCILWAARNGRLDTLKTAAVHGAVHFNGNYEKYCPWMYFDGPDFASPLHLAIKHKHPQIVAWLLEKKVNIDIPSSGLCECSAPVGTDSWYPLHTAMCVGDEATALLLIDHGAFMSARNTDGLFCAIRFGYIRLVDALIQSPEFDPYRMLSDYAETSSVRDPDSVEFCPDERVAVEIVHKLVDRGVPVNLKTSILPSFCSATSKGCFKVAMALMDHGAICTCARHPVFAVFDSSHESWSGRNVLGREYGAEEIAEEEERRLDRAELLSRVIARYGYSDAEDERGWDFKLATPLFRAAAYAFDANCVRILLDAGARVDGTLHYYEQVGFSDDAFIDPGWSVVEWITPGVPQTQIWGILKVTGGYLTYLSAYHLKELKDTIKLLLQRGASIDQLNGKESALELACSHPSSVLESGVLKCIVENASVSNISLQHLETVMKRCSRQRNGVELTILLKQMHEAVSTSNLNVESGSGREETGANPMEDLVS
ncbi:hypothetical protein AK830_g6891 [Neonectria ditissima]|uniref:Uncharacterized protein n=1 Tax=Neonectria ditissima TaxID=78410 RepID=A0A0P7B110_9HYPO|nr:hypothetical protein AK830_g6891 [Neonectria ditissima]